MLLHGTRPGEKSGKRRAGLTFAIGAQSPALRNCTPKLHAASAEELAVSIEIAGPFNPNMYDKRADAIAHPPAVASKTPDRVVSGPEAAVSSQRVDMAIVWHLLLSARWLNTASKSDGHIPRATATFEPSRSARRRPALCKAP